MTELDVAKAHEAGFRAGFRTAVVDVRARAQHLKGTRGPVSFHLKELADDMEKSVKAPRADGKMKKETKKSAELDLHRHRVDIEQGQPGP